MRCNDAQSAGFKLRLLKGETTVISLLFPFSKFFADAPQPLFPGDSYESDLEIAEGCFRYLGKLEFWFAVASKQIVFSLETL